MRSRIAGSSAATRIDAVTAAPPPRESAAPPNVADPSLSRLARRPRLCSLIDRRFVGADRVEEVSVFFLRERLDRPRQLLFHHAAHREDAGANAFHLDVELLVDVVLGHAVVLSVSNRSAR